MTVEEVLEMMREVYKNDTIYYDEEKGLILDSDGKAYATVVDV